MRLKEAPKTNSRLIGSVLLHRQKYKIDMTYQREKGTWKRPDEQYFIDTILRGLGMPPIFLHKKKKDVYYIVDGQQRFNTILKFKDNKLNLSEKYSNDIIDDLANKEKNKERGAYRYTELAPEWRDRFDNYPLPITELEDYSDEEIRDLFRRLQHAKPLVAGEILNSYSGSTVLSMRELAKNNFFSNITAIGAKRYKHYYVAAILIYLEGEGIKEVKPRKIYDFFESNKDINTSSKVYKKVKKVLDYITDVFQSKTPELNTPPWVITICLLVSYLIDNYAIHEQKDSFKKFFLEFYKEVADSTQTHDDELIKLNNAFSYKTNDRATIQLRHDTILRRFLNALNPVSLDENRLFTRKQKITIFRRDQEKCQICDKKLIFDNPDTQFHHKDKYIEGGQTEINKGQLLCRECHLNKIHGVRSKW